MKIGQFENKAPTTAVGDRKAPTAGAPAGAAPGKVAEPSVKVDLSATVAHLATGGHEGVFDSAKVQRISDAIRDGRFSVNPEAIADKLIANAQELLGSVRKR